MERAFLWFKCAAMHDPVRPVIKKPAVIGWEAKHRRVDLIIERPLKGEELLERMKGWFTADIHQVVDIVGRYGKLKLIDDYDLVVQTKDTADMESLSNSLNQTFQDEVWIEYIPQKRLD